ncbi:MULTISPECIES: response regulator transcription factor [Nocardiopsis]|jgi:DNA-binding response OmpR family regulator|uniref:Sensory transduction protein RegX3 n=1 Tax=Nocardiopsis dassonvillei (strain ATCC 23218 / DSM 43111 / CIP 107115 / JCM 7437 / KCTC 9190 / NBRC 14626 / NCTC 10488 / NRRL B-5397 / IMRU 509) TaxID=446468 RepID=D7AY24_NOCDD|nr:MULTISPECIES: response regulator transcription factor [Nocardiopsis]ADH69902.1 two component transcriptional regulator, winged helix family [Nocardiopsis dassonvillei subsp. dassonvillei DSM 43111]APC37888.1 DNA-binding response regulator [Nocardiopsis dassonvillei]ASU60809.1 DNA-binding response regulator [Nocardiopsis dassonvillei]NKY77451.1 response regulator transcription factor [Nocardiopsis dassonvillei]VEI90415.1 Response regulator ArlR [Nocardiopsis dassonvillei]
MLDMRILVVEDDDRVARGLVTALRAASFDVQRVATAERALSAPPADVVLLDLGLPDADGIDLLRKLRDRPQTAIIAVTARSEERDRVRGLRAGADDYVVKPFGVAELLARIDAVLRRTRAARAEAAEEEPAVRIGELTVDPGSRAASVGGAELQLTRKEFDLLALLASRSPSVVARDQILDQVWGTAWETSSRTLDTHIGSLRAKLGRAVQIRTVRGVGYLLDRS